MLPTIRLFWIITALAACLAVAPAVWLMLPDARHAARPMRLGSGVPEIAAGATFSVVLALTPPVLTALYLGVIRGELRRRVLATRAKLCIHCAHSLVGRPPESNACPECGRAVRTQDAVRWWCRFLTA